MKLRPFFNAAIEFEDNIFLTSYVKTRYFSDYYSLDSSSALKETQTSSLKATIGEYIERDTVFNYGKEIVIDAVNLVTGELKEFLISDFLLNLELESLKYKEPKYADTTGVATHTSSFVAIKNALYEFIERQSLIMSWVTMNPGNKIENNVINKYQNELILKEYELHINDISLFNHFYVIFIIGINYRDQLFVAGCSCDKDINTAIENAMQEVTILARSYVNKKSVFPTEFESNKKQFDEIKNLYARTFYSMSVKEFSQKCAFLINNNKYRTKSIEGDKDSEGLNDLDIKSLGLDIYCIFIPSMNNSYFKTVKVFSPEAFPHMNTEILNPTNYRITELYKIDDFPNKFKALPFP